MLNKHSIREKIVILFAFMGFVIFFFSVSVNAQTSNYLDGCSNNVIGYSTTTG